MGPTPAKWPPVLTKSPEVLGYLKDVNQIGYSRDIGRSFTLSGNVYHMYGDTFCKNKDGKFVGVVCNTISKVVDNARPLESSYLEINNDGVVQPLLQLNQAEKDLQKNNPDQRVVLWSFGGVVEIESGVGLMWYTSGIDHNPGNGQSQYYEHKGTGIAQVKVDPKTGKLTAQRYPSLLFSSAEPGFGSFTAYLENGFVYVFGEVPEDGSMALARTTKDTFSSRDGYDFWDGKGWKHGDFAGAVPVFKDIPQGAVFRSTFFGQDRPYVMVGVSKWADSKIRVGSAPTLTGPWEIYEVGTAKGIDNPDNYMYCIYPHMWATNEENILMVSWSEHWPGGVIMGKLSFATQVKQLSFLEKALQALCLS